MKFFGILLTMIIGIYITVDFFEKIKNFIEAGPYFSRVFTYFIFKIPLIIAQVSPVCILLAVLITFGLMNKNNEILALKSSGSSIYYLVKPIFVIGIFFSLFLFFLSEVIVPLTITKANQIWRQDVKKQTVITSEEKNIWIKGNHLITHIKYYNPVIKSIYGATFYYFDKDFRLIRRIDAKSGVFEEGKWVLYELMEQDLQEKNKNPAVTFHDKIIKQLDFLPEDLKRVIKKPEEMSFKELLTYIRKVEEEGYDATIYRVDLFAKLALPLVCVILCILGTGIAVRGKRMENIFVSIAYGIGIAFFYWVFHSFCLSIGYGEMLPPFIAAWAANFVFLSFAIYTLLNAD